jgi:hypothetical protein
VGWQVELEEILGWVVPLFLESGPLYDRFQPPEAEDVQEVVPGGVWEAPIYPSGSESAQLLRVYATGQTTGPLLQAHWRNETRTLLRISGRQHRSLPRLHEARLIGDAGLGYLILDDTGFADFEGHLAFGEMRHRPSVAWRQLLSVIEAASILHQEGIIHRSIGPETVRALDDSSASVVVDGFQLSGFVATWLRRARSSGDSPAFLPTAAESRVFLAPERLGPLFGGQVERLESFATDVFSLGLLGAAWFLGEKPLGAAGDIFRGGYDRRRHEELVGLVIRRLRRSRLPKPLVRLLENMCAFEAANRIPSAIAAYDAICKIYGKVLADLNEAERGEEQPSQWRVLYLQQSIERMYDDGLGRSPKNAPAFDEYSELISKDLDRAVLTWSPRGFEPWESRGSRENARRAKLVLLGQSYAYFCNYLDEHRGKTDRTAIVVKHMLPIEQARELRVQPHQAPAPRVTAGYLRPGGRRRKAEGAPSWEPLFSSVEFADPRSEVRPVANAASWLLNALEAELRVHEYHYLVIARGPATVDVRGRRQTVEDWPEADERSAFARLWLEHAVVAEMGRGFEDLYERSLQRADELVFLARAGREPHEFQHELRWRERLDDQTVRFELVEPDAGFLPELGFVRAQDVAQRSVLASQRRALAVVEDHYQHLAAQLRAPGSLSIPAESRFAANTVKDEETLSLIQRVLDQFSSRADSARARAAANHCVVLASS